MSDEAMKTTTYRIGSAERRRSPRGGPLSAEAAQRVSEQAAQRVRREESLAQIQATLTAMAEEWAREWPKIQKAFRDLVAALTAKQ